MTYPLFIYQPENINNSPSNGGRMTGRRVEVGQANGVGGFPPISLAEQASGVTKTRKEFIKFADSLNRLIIRAIIFLSAPSLATDSRGYFIAGTQRDQQSAIGSRKYATGALNADIVTGNTALVVDFELGSGADLVVQAGDTIAIMDNTHENILTVNTITWTGDQAAITLTTGVVNDFLAAETNVAACLVVENVTTSFDNVTKSFVGSTYDEGTYRNLMFLNVEQFNIPEIMQNLIDYFNKNQLTILHLHDYYYQTKNQPDEIEYFTLRHLVREYGEEYGLYFNGKSGSDSVSLDSEIKRFTQSDVIIKELNESKVAMTSQEIAERLRSKSTAHAGFLLNTLMEEGKVVRVDKMVYTTPEKVFSNMDTKAIMQVIQDIMNTSDNVIVEADVFREYVNMELNLSYSKYIYVALVKTQLKELGWYRNNTLFSKKEIPYKSLAEICDKFCNPELSTNENVKILQEIVWITDSVAANSLQWWKWQMNH